MFVVLRAEGEFDLPHHINKHTPCNPLTRPTGNVKRIRTFSPSEHWRQWCGNQNCVMCTDDDAVAVLHHDEEEMRPLAHISCNYQECNKSSAVTQGKYV
jgi:hypothetical protein